MVGWHHRLNGHEFEQTPGDSANASKADDALLFLKMDRNPNITVPTRK